MKKVIKKQFTCAVCNKIFLYYDWEKRIPKYCSKKCWSVRNPRVLNNCIYCGKEQWIWLSTKKNKDHIYCSRKCANEHRKDWQRGENSHLWRGGKTKLNQLERARAKYREWRTLVFIRDNYTCQKCRIRCGLGKKIYLHAHHKKSFADYKELRYEISNGITLCKNCHLLEHNHKF